MKVEVAVVPESQCFILGTRYTPDLNAEKAAVATAKACQVMCTQTEGCRFFSYLKTSKTCSLQGEGATPVFYEDSVAGPQLCHNIPQEAEPPADELETDSPGTIFTSFWFWCILVLICCLCVAALYFMFRKGRLCFTGWRRQYSRPKKREEAKLNEHRYMALPPTDQELEQNMLAQAASDAAGQGSPLQSLHPVDFTGKFPGSANYNGSWGTNGSQWSWQVDRMSTAPRDTLDHGNGSPRHLGVPPSGFAQSAWGPSRPTSSWQQSPRSSDMREDSPDWMPHFLGVEAVRESYQSYDASQRAYPPERSSWPAPQMPQRRGRCCALPPSLMGVTMGTT